MFSKLSTIEIAEYLSKDRDSAEQFHSQVTALRKQTNDESGMRAVGLYYAVDAFDEFS